LLLNGKNSNKIENSLQANTWRLSFQGFLQVMQKVGVLALQGGFEPHVKTLQRLGVSPVLVKRGEHLKGISGLILPGGESSTNIKLLEHSSLKEKIYDFYKRKYPLFGTCAGIILLAQRVLHINQFSFGFIELQVERNAYGSQRESFIENIAIHSLGDSQFPCVFIRAPILKNISEKVEVLARFKENPILVKQDKVLGATFHPELTEDTRLHALFLQMCAEREDVF
jgi:5'-phosphate synthase pdxT subunit